MEGVTETKFGAEMKGWKNNFCFQWELQVWNKIDEINNINSHERYKQDYVRWENENKGEISNGNTLYIYE